MNATSLNVCFIKWLSFLITHMQGNQFSINYWERYLMQLYFYGLIHLLLTMVSENRNLWFFLYNLRIDSVLYFMEYYLQLSAVYRYEGVATMCWISLMAMMAHLNKLDSYEPRDNISQPNRNISTSIVIAYQPSNEMLSQEPI